MKVKLDENLGTLGPGRLRLAHLERALAMVVEAARTADVRGRLWIAEVHRVREYFGRSE